MDIFKTTEGHIEVMSADGEAFFFDESGKRIAKAEGEKTNKLRSDSSLYKSVVAEVEKMNKKKLQRTVVDKIKGFDVFLDRNDYSLNIDIAGDVVKLDNEAVAKIKSEFSTMEKLKIQVESQAGAHQLGDRVLIYGPTGTGKTYDFLNTVEAMIKDKTLDDYEVVTITEGFEDIDFLAHIVPSEKGITYNEKKIVKLLKDAANGKRVAILLDELNRGSKSFLNLVLKLLDAVDGKNYVLSNFIKDETIIIPIENVLFFATMNLGGKYVGTNALDEALFDRFNRVLYKGYDKDVEAEMFKAFGPMAAQAEDIVKYVRDIHKDGEIRAPISTRGVKMWAECFINSAKTPEDLVNGFNITLLKRLVSVDDFGNPNIEEESIILRKFKDLGLIK